MISITDHPLRYAIANELHARPFPAIAAPSSAAFLATKLAENAAGRDRDLDSAHFDAHTFGIFPPDWLALLSGVRLTSAVIRIEVAESDDGISQKAGNWFVEESLAISRVLENGLVIAGDFRIDSSGHMHFGIFARPDAGDRRIGRVVQYWARCKPTRRCRCLRYIGQMI